MYSFRLQSHSALSRHFDLFLNLASSTDELGGGEVGVIYLFIRLTHQRPMSRTLLSNISHNIFNNIIVRLLV